MMMMIIKFCVNSTHITTVWAELLRKYDLISRSRPGVEVMMSPVQWVLALVVKQPQH